MADIGALTFRRLLTALRALRDNPEFATLLQLGQVLNQLDQLNQTAGAAKDTSENTSEA